MATYQPKKFTFVKGSDSYIINTESANAQLLCIDCGTVSTLPKTVSNAEITSNMICVSSVIGTKSAQKSPWSVTTANGSVTIDGTINGSTTLVIYLAQVSN